MKKKKEEKKLGKVEEIKKKVEDNKPLTGEELDHIHTHNAHK